jgi:hypothetical protein
MGALYRRNNSRMWWAKYYVDGRPVPAWPLVR